MDQRGSVWVKVLPQGDENEDNSSYHKGTVSGSDATRVISFHNDGTYGIIRDQEEMVTVSLSDGSCNAYPITTVYHANDKSLLDTASDLTALTFLEEPNVLHSLDCRFAKNEIYSSIAGIMIAVNPYCSLPIYSKLSMKQYHSGARNLPPHIYSIAEVSFSALTAPFNKKLKQRPQNQSLINVGESGAGKTENAKHIMRYLANRSTGDALTGDGADVNVGKVKIEGQIMDTNAVLEMFGNAQTLLNHNSSRFGKFTKMYFRTRNVYEDEEDEDENSSPLDHVCGASTETYLLEKSRVVLQSSGERNFHSFYGLFQGLSSEHMKSCGLTDSTASDFSYTRQGVPKSKSDQKQVNKKDKVRFEEMISGMEALDIGQELQKEIIDTLAAVLHMGNIEFVEDQSVDEDACDVSLSSCHHLEKAASLLGVDPEEFKSRLISRTLTVRNTVIKSRLKPEEAAIARDAVAKATYELLFLWIVDVINSTLEQDMELPWIGILDVFGFEKFQLNSLEQFCINFANEMLQTHFNHSILISEQKEYERESIVWKPIELPDGKSMLSLIQKSKTGILPLLDSACFLPTGTVDYFMSSLWEYHSDNMLLSRSTKRNVGRKSIKQSKHVFVLTHYAGNVEYTCDEFLPKNKDRADPEVSALFTGSGCNNTVTRAIFVSGEKREGELGLGTRQSRGTSVSSTFRKQLTSLMDTLGKTQSHFIRCIKPNLKAKPGVYDCAHVKPQLQCGGLVQAVKILKCGYPTRVRYAEVFKQFSPLLSCPANRLDGINHRDFCQAILAIFGLGTSDFQLGLTKVFFKSERRELLHTILNFESPLTQTQMTILFKELARRKWKRVLSVVRSSALIFRSIERKRAVALLQKTSRILVIYHNTARRALLRARHRIKIRKVCILQSLLRTCSATMNISHQWSIKEAERKRLEEIERKRIEEEARLEKEKEELEQARQDALNQEVAAARLAREKAVLEREALRLKLAGEEEARLRQEQERVRVEEEEKQLRKRREEEERQLKIRREEEDKQARIRAEEELRVARIRAEEERLEKIRLETMSREAEARRMKEELERREEIAVQESQKEEATRIELAAACFLGADQYEPLEIEEGLVDWIEDFLGEKLSGFLLEDLCDGTLLVRIFNKISPRLRLHAEDPAIPGGIESNVEKCMRVATAFGIPSEFIFDSSALATDSSREQVFSCLAHMRDTYIAQSTRRGSRRTQSRLSSNDNKDNLVTTAAEVERLDDLLQDNQDLRSELEEAYQEIARLQDTITRLNTLNRNIVEDLGHELQARVSEDVSASDASKVKSVPDAFFNENEAVLQTSSRMIRNARSPSRKDGNCVLQ